MTFTAFTEAQWEVIRSTRENWPEGVDWLRAIERIGQDYWELRALKEMWLRGKQPAKQREKIRKAWKLMRQLQKVLAELADDGLFGDDFPPPNLNWPEHRVKEWLSDYNFWVRPFAGQSNPIQSELEWRLMNLEEVWRKAALVEKEG